MCLFQHLGAIARIFVSIVANTAKNIEEQRRLDNFHYVYIQLHACVCGKHTFSRFLTLITWLFRLYLGLARTHTHQALSSFSPSCFLTGRLAPMWERQLADVRVKGGKKHSVLLSLWRSNHLIYVYVCIVQLFLFFFSFSRRRRALSLPFFFVEYTIS